MTSYAFVIEEVAANGRIFWEAVEVPTGLRVPLVTPMRAGEYPDIEAFLKQAPNNVDVILKYLPIRGDEFDQDKQTWKFKSGPHVILVQDIPRTVLNFTILR